MTIRLGVLPYGPSDSCRDLRDALNVAFRENNQVTPRLIKTQNSEFRGRTSDVIVNYGNRSAPAEVFGQATVLNQQVALNNAANKTNALNRMSSATPAVTTVPYTTDRNEAMRWLAAGDTVYARATLTGHSGEGITVHTGAAPETQSALPVAPLYTKAITGQRREWRVHVFKGVITYVQVKRRANGYQDNPLYQEEVRNHQTGWIYATENINPSSSVLRNAVNAVAALGLDFGAVDIISRREESWVLEVNTAPGLTGTTLETFTRNVVEFVEARRMGRVAAYMARFPVPAEDPVAPTAPTAAPRSNEPEQAPASSPRQAAAPNVPNVGEAVVAALQMQHNPSRTGEASQRPDGYYMASVTNQDSGVSQRVILWLANGRYYRHGWNHPLESNRVSQISAIGSVTLAGGEAVNLNFATQE